MRTRIRELLLGLAVIGLVVAIPSPASAADQVSGVGWFDAAGECGAPPSGYEDFTDFTMVITGDLEGCWYTKIEYVKDNGAPSGTYRDGGQEVFVGSLDGGPVGTFSTTYRSESKWAADGSEIHGRCQHKVADGSGVDGFAGLGGRIDFKDEVDTGLFLYRGHLRLG